MYFNYHAKAKKKIREGKCTGFKIVEHYHNISPCLLLFFDDDSIMPIRKYKFDDYLFLLFSQNIKEK